MSGSEHDESYRYYRTDYISQVPVIRYSTAYSRYRQDTVADEEEQYILQYGVRSSTRRKVNKIRYYREKKDLEEKLRSTNKW
jgi:hypothetical protein